MSDLHYTYSIAIGIIGITSTIVHLFISTIWIAYLFGWYMTKHKSHNNIFLHNLHIDWPKCSLRLSTRIYIFLMIIGGFLMYLTDAIRVIYLSITWIDLRIAYNEWFCRGHIFLQHFSMDSCNWIFTLLCLERLTVSIFTHPTYSLMFNTKKILSIQILIILLISLLTSSIYFIPSEKVCEQYFYNPNFIYSRFILSSLLPTIISMISSCYLIKICYQREIKFQLTYRLINLRNKQLRNLSIRLMHKMIAAKITLFTSCIFLLFQLILFILMIKNVNYCCYLLFIKPLNNEDYFYILFNLIFCILHTMKLYLLILSSSCIHYHIRQIITLIKLQLCLCYYVK
ncbi:hypothetical protein MN116_004123 [Schistosoma mekongi]|uniref:G-protein coupled receptors family 1 profile domain-containing protein n=1 Tax=Schistosoma mekongi TaxID=38744 RepID=A0AAE1ZFS3_SCHME|nr:hypothetical protein MN116_004123 [Schistosoma mekongi]